MLLEDRPWTREEDAFLLSWGGRLNLAFGGEPHGYEFVAEFELLRDATAAVERVAYLREHQPDLVREIEIEFEQG